MNGIRLTSLVPGGGCASKLCAKDLVHVLRNMTPVVHPWVDPAVGPMEDAAILRPKVGPPLIFTVDFFTPIVDEPAAFGAIAAANALSDVYAMGGEPVAALAVCGFPTDKLPLDVLEQIFLGGRSKAAEAGCAIVGGHTVVDPELKYGLCVIGVVEGAEPLSQIGARPGDRLVLTKLIGTGIAANAIKKGTLPDEQRERVIAGMSTLNKAAKDAALAAGARAATDVTGFGLLGHLYHLLLGSQVAARVYADAVPVYDFVRPLAEAGLVPGGTKKNMAYVEPHVRWDEAVSAVDRLILCDAQTSGGLLVAVPPENVDTMLAELERRGAPVGAVIGEIVEGETGRMEVVAGRT